MEPMVGEAVREAAAGLRCQMQKVAPSARVQGSINAGSSHAAQGRLQ